MPRDPNKPDTAIIDVPLTSGLSQKHDARLLPLGQSSNATNVTLTKTGSLQKTQGMNSLSVASPINSITANSITRLATLDYGLNAVATDSLLGTTGVWSRDEAGNSLCLNDRVSECYIPPTFGVLAQSTQPIELDTCVLPVASTPYELHVGLWQISGIPQVFYSVTEASTEVQTPDVDRTFIVPNTPVAVLNNLSHVWYAPKVVLCGTTAVLTVHDVQGNTIWGTTLNLAAPWTGWSAAVALVTDTAPTASAFSHNTAGVYDTAAIDDVTTEFILAYERNVTGTLSIRLARFTTGLASIAAGALSDSVWTAAAVDITGIAVRASSAGGAAWVAYSYNTGSVTSPVTVVNAGALVYPGLASAFCNPAGAGSDLTGGYNTYPAPQVLDIKSAGVVNGLPSQKVMWSPPPQPIGTGSGTTGPAVTVGSTAYNSNVTNAGPVCAIFSATIYTAGGGAPFTTTNQPNSPRWTNGVVLASRMALVTNAAGTTHAYVAGWIPSNNQIPGATSIQSAVVTNPGEFYSSNANPPSSGIAYPPWVSLSGGGGSGASVAITISTAGTGTIASASIANGGAGYTSAPTVHLNFGTGATFGAVFVSTLGGGITQVVVTNGGSGYNQTPQTVPILIQDAGGTGSGFQGWAIVSSTGAITGVQIVSSGSNYSSGGNCHASVQVSGHNGAVSVTVPSNQTQNVQGTFYLFCDDTFQDVTSPNNIPPLTATSVNVPLRLVGLWKPRLGKGATLNQAHVLPHLVANPNASYTGNLIQTDLPITLTTSVPVSTICSADFVNEFQSQTGELGGLIGLAGGLSGLYDGSRTADFAFPYYPENIVATPSNISGGGQLQPGTYQYIAIYSRRDSSGAIHRSGRSVATTVVCAQSNTSAVANTYTVSLQVPTMGFSTAQRGVSQEDATLGIGAPTPCFIEVYRTQNGGTNFYNIQAQPTTIGLTNAQNTNSLASPYLLIFDTIDDADLANNAKLYGDGLNGTTPNSIIDNLCPPPFQGLITHKTRWWGYDGNQVWYSKALTDGEGPGFNELQAFSVDDGPGPITGLASMDERLIIFKRDRIFYVTGDGPADNFTQNDLQPPQKIQSDVGCIDWRSVVGSPVGVWFETANGLFQLTRKFEVQPGGKFVEDTLNTYSDITSATLDMRNGLIAWTANAPSQGPFLPSLGVVVYYNYVLDAWTLQQVFPPTGQSPVLASGCLSGPNLALTLAGSQGATPYLLRQTTGTGTGSYMVGANPTTGMGGTYQSAIWSSPWIKNQTPQGWLRFQAVKLLWLSLDAHTLNVGIAYDYSNSYSEVYTVSAGAQASVTTPLVEWYFMPASPQAQSMRVQVFDTQDTSIAPSSGQGYQLVACTIEAMDQGGTTRFSISQRGSA